MFKNVASQKLIVFAFDSTNNTPKTGDAANITAYVSKDYGSVTVLGDTSATEMDSTNAKGYYLFDLTQGETNADTLLFSAKSSTANIVVIGVPATVFTLPTTGILAPTTSGRTLDVSAGGEAGVDWANVGSQNTSVNLSATTINLANTTTTVTNQLTAAAIATGVWQDSTSGDFTVASSIGKSLYIANVAPGGSGGHLISGSNSGTTTLGALTVSGATTLTGAVTASSGSNSINLGTDSIGSTQLASSGVNEIVTAVWTDLLASSDFSTASSIGKLLKDDIDATISSRLATASYTAPTNLTAAQIATGVWTDTTAGDFTVALSIGKSILNGVSLGTGLTIASVSGAVGSVTGAVGSVTGNVGGNVTGSVGSIASGGIAAASFASGAIDAAAIATDALGSLELAAGAASEIATAVRTELSTELARIDVAVSTRGTSTVTTAQVNAEVLDVVGTDTLVAGVTIKESLRRIGAITSGVVSGAGTGSEIFRDYAQSVNTIVITVDSSGNRTTITYN